MSRRTTSTPATSCASTLLRRRSAGRGGIRDLALRAAYYKRLIDPASEPDPETRAGLQRLGRWGAQTAHPVLMVALDLHARGVVTDVGPATGRRSDRVVLRAPPARAHPDQRAQPGLRPARSISCRKTTVSSTRYIGSCRATGSTGPATTRSARQFAANRSSTSDAGISASSSSNSLSAASDIPKSSTSRRPSCRSSTSCPRA